MSGNRVGGFYTSAMGFGFNTEVLKKKHLPEPRCWADLVKPEYKGEVEMSHPATSGTGYTIVAGLVQLMGEDAAFDYLKKLHRNTNTYTRSGQAQAPNVAKGEVAVGISFIFGFDKWRHDKYPVKTAAPCEGTGYEIGGIALVKGARNKANAQRYYDWLMSPAGQAIGAQAGSLQSPANRTFKPDPRIPSMDGVKLIRYDFEKYGQAAERKRLIDRWTREVESQPR
jgi:iron(III) transport system substrate-binding protein